MKQILFFISIMIFSVRCVVDPLFNSDLYTHNPITTQYADDLILINIDFWGIGREREVSMIVIQNKQIVKLDWNEKH